MFGFTVVVKIFRGSKWSWRADKHGIVFCEHGQFDLLSSTSSEHFEKTFGEHRVNKNI